MRQLASWDAFFSPHKWCVRGIHCVSFHNISHQLVKNEIAVPAGASVSGYHGSTNLPPKCCTLTFLWVYTLVLMAAPWYELSSPVVGLRVVIATLCKQFGGGFPLHSSVVRWLLKVGWSLVPSTPLSSGPFSKTAVVMSPDLPPLHQIRIPQGEREGLVTFSWSLGFVSLVLRWLYTDNKFKTTNSDPLPDGVLVLQHATTNGVLKVQGTGRMTPLSSWVGARDEAWSVVPDYSSPHSCGCPDNTTLVWLSWQHHTRVVVLATPHKFSFEYTWSCTNRNIGQISDILCQLLVCSGKSQLSNKYVNVQYELGLCHNYHVETTHDITTCNISWQPHSISYFLKPWNPQHTYANYNLIYALRFVWVSQTLSCKESGFTQTVDYQMIF